jgi:hypothetical protein
LLVVVVVAQVPVLVVVVVDTVPLLELPAAVLLLKLHCLCVLEPLIPLQLAVEGMAVITSQQTAVIAFFQQSLLLVVAKVEPVQEKPLVMAVRVAVQALEELLEPVRLIRDMVVVLL